METIAVYAGSFDPITNGHMWMIEQGSILFDKVIVAVGSNPDKKGRFSVSERMEMIDETLDAHFEKSRYDTSIRYINNVFIESFENTMLINYAKSQKARYLLRGIRSVKDYEYEREMMHINYDICPDIQTIFLFPPRHIAEVSSSAVMGMVGFEGWEKVVNKYVPENVLNKMREKHASKLANMGK